MKTNQYNRILAALLLAGSLTLPAAAAHAAELKAFATPDAAMEAFGAALQDDDEAVKEAVLGKNFREVIPPVGADLRYRFLENWAKLHKIEMDGENKARIAVGDSGWTLPIPLVKTRAGWQFDLKAGKEEMVVREIGRNELAAIRVARVFVDAQREYAAKDRNGDSVPEYAQRIASSAGKMDGLYWPTGANEEPSPLGRLLADAAADKGRKPGSYRGYSFRILTAQGPDAPGGARSYLADGRMTGGFGLLAWPTRYGTSGIMSFKINQDGQVFEKNLGPGTAEQAARIKTFNPDATWRKVEGKQ